MKNAPAYDPDSVIHGIDLSSGVRLLRRRLATIIIVFFVVCVPLAVYTYKTYIDSTVVYISRYRIALKPTVEKKDVDRRRDKTGIYVLSLDYDTESFVKLINSGSTLEQVARQVYGSKVNEESWGDEEYFGFVDEVRKWKETSDVIGVDTRVGVYLSKPPNENIITMMVADEDPDMAYNIAKNWLEVVERESIEYKENIFQQRKEVLEQQKEDAAALLETSIKELNELMEKSTMKEVIKADKVTLDEKAISSRLFELKRQTSSLESTLKNLEQRKKDSYISAYNYILAIDPKLIDKTYRDTYEKEIDSLKDLLRVNTEIHPDVIEAKRRLKITESRMASEVDSAIDRLKVQYEGVIKEQKRLENLVNEGVYGDLRLYRQLQSRISEEKQKYEDIDKEINDVSLAHRLSAGPLFTVKTYPTKPTKPYNLKFIEEKRNKHFVFSFLIAFALSLGFAFLKDMTDVTIKDINDLEDIGWLVLTAMPLQKGVNFPPVISSHPNSITAQAIKLLRADLEFVTADSGIKTIAITSALPEEGVSFTALNLAHACSLAGKKTLLVETDFKNPKLSRYFKIKTSEGSLRNISYNKEIEPFKTNINNLWVVSANGSVDKSDVILRESDISRYITKWKDEFDWVIFDCPSLQVYSNSGIIIKSVGGVIPVVLAHRTSKRSVVRLQYMLESANLNVLGAVLNGMKKVEDSGLRYIKES